MKFLFEIHILLSISTYCIPSVISLRGEIYEIKFWKNILPQHTLYKLKLPEPEISANTLCIMLEA